MTVRNLDALRSAMTKREKLLQILRSLSYADPLPTLDELGEQLYCTPRTVQRHIEWLQDRGDLPLRIAAFPRTAPVESTGAVPENNHVAGSDTYSAERL